MKIVLINGAPRSGKDSAGAMMQQELPGRWEIMKFSAGMKERCHAAYGMHAAHDAFEEVKDQKLDCFLGLSPREAYIHFSETWMKKVHGDDVFGQLMAQQLKLLVEMHPEIRGFLMTDSGFRSESEVMVREFGADAITVIRLHRHGYNFDGDSRGLVDLTDLGVKTYDVNSPDGDLPGLLDNIKSKVPFLFRSET
jgi:hypothetical protein